MPKQRQKASYVRKRADIQRNLASIVASGKRLGQVVKAIFSVMEENVKISGKLLYLRDDKEGHFISFPLKGGRRRILASDSKNSVASIVRDTAKPLILPDARKHADYSRRVDIALQRGARAIACFPLLMGKNMVGVLELSSEAFTKEDVESIMSFLDFLSIACAHALNLARIEDLTITDDLTGLFNARHLKRMIDMEVRRAERYQGVFSVIFIDLDNFKNVNDLYGHLVGSRILQEIGKLMVNSLRQDVDMAFRYGGDEYVMFLPNTGRDGAMAVANRLRYLISSRTFRNDDNEPFNVTASFGIAAFPEEAHRMEDILRLADEAMYRAKGFGRDRIFAFGKEADRS